MSERALQWLVPGEVKEHSYARGEISGPGSMEDFQERVRYLKADTADDVGRMLWSTNQESVNHRYDDEELEEIYFFAESKHFVKTLRIDPIQVCKAIHCFEYQSCEHSEWESSEAHAFCRALESHAIRHMAGYEDAEWGAPC